MLALNTAARPAHALSKPGVIAIDPALLHPSFGAFAQLAVHLAGALVILIITFWASRWISRGAGQAVARMNRRHGPDRTLQGFVSSVVRYAIWVIGLIAVLDQLGVRATSIIAVLGAASLAIGLAMQGALSNVAAGVMLLIFRPYKVGEFVEIAGKQGTVRALDLFTTELSSSDNLRITVPNAKAFGDIVTNYTRMDRRRIELSFGIDYGDDLDLALELLKRSAAEDRRILRDPAPWAKVTALCDSSVTVTARAWVGPADYWDAQFDLIKRIKERFEAEGLSFPYPHQVGVTWEEAHPEMQPRVDQPQPISRQ